MAHEGCLWPRGYRKGQVRTSLLEGDYGMAEDLLWKGDVEAFGRQKEEVAREAHQKRASHHMEGYLWR